MEQISDEMLAYLNENLDLVTEYMHTHPNGGDARVPLSRHAVEVGRRFDNVDNVDNKYVVIKINYKTWLLTYPYSYEWRDLVEYVEDNDNNAPPVLK